MAKSVATLTSNDHKFQSGTVLVLEEKTVEKGVTWWSFRYPDGTLVHLKYHEFTWGI
jgi:hypothetical protein